MGCGQSRKIFTESSGLRVELPPRRQSRSRRSSTQARSFATPAPAPAPAPCAACLQSLQGDDLFDLGGKKYCARCLLTWHAFVACVSWNPISQRFSIQFSGTSAGGRFPSTDGLLSPDVDDLGVGWGAWSRERKARIVESQEESPDQGQSQQQPGVPHEHFGFQSPIELIGQERFQVIDLNSSPTNSSQNLSPGSPVAVKLSPTSQSTALLRSPSPPSPPYPSPSREQDATGREWIAEFLSPELQKQRVETSRQILGSELAWLRRREEENVLRALLIRGCVVRCASCALVDQIGEISFHVCPPRPRERKCSWTCC